MKLSINARHFSYFPCDFRARFVRTSDRQKEKVWRADVIYYLVYIKVDAVLYRVKKVDRDFGSTCDGLCVFHHFKKADEELGYFFSLITGCSSSAGFPFNISCCITFVCVCGSELFRFADFCPMEKTLAAGASTSRVMCIKEYKLRQGGQSICIVNFGYIYTGRVKRKATAA